MSVAPLHSSMHALGVDPAPTLPPTRDGTGFARAMQAAAAGDRSVGRVAAEQLVAAAFVEPVLALTRDATFTEGAFAPGAAERRFGPLLDQHLAERMVRGAHFPLVDRIEDKLFGPRPAAGPARSPGGLSA